MTSKYQNAKKYFITSKIEAPLEKVLQEHLPAVNADNLIKSGGIWRNRSRLSSAETHILAGDTLIVYVAPDQGRKYKLDPKTIIKETKDWLVIDKPSAITVASDRSNTTYNLTFAVGEYLKSKNCLYTPTPITRLDFMVQGLVIYPKSKSAEIKLFKAMMNGDIDKTYVAALPSHDPITEELIVKDKIGFKGKTSIDPEGKEAISELKFLKRELEIDYYLMRPITGRRHQLRFHAARHLKPLIGDTLYGSKYTHPDEKIALIAIKYKLECDHQIVEIELPNWQEKIAHIASEATLKKTH